MILLDTKILIEILKNNRKTIEQVQSLDQTLAISSIIVMEQGLQSRCAGLRSCLLTGWIALT